MWLPSQPGEEFRVGFAPKGKVSRRLVTPLASDQNRKGGAGGGTKRRTAKLPLDECLRDAAVM